MLINELIEDGMKKAGEIAAMTTHEQTQRQAILWFQELKTMKQSVLKLENRARVVVQSIRTLCV